MPRVSERPNGGLRVEMFGVVPLSSPLGSNIEGLNFAFKRALDVAVGTLLVIAAAPILAAGALGPVGSPGKAQSTDLSLD
jgi:hypothetical protein